MFANRIEHLLAASSMLVVGAIGAATIASTPVEPSAAQAIDGSFQRAYESRFLEALPTRDWTTGLWNAVRYAALGEVNDGAVPGRDGWLFTAEEFAEPQETRDLAHDIAHARDTLAAMGVRLVPVIVPDKARIMRDKLPRGRSEAFAGRYDRTLAVIGAAGLSAIDLRSAMTEASASFMRTDSHWSPAGTRAAAEAVATALADAGLPETAFTTEVGDERPFEGDLLNFVDTGPWQSLVGPAAETIQTYETVAMDAGLGDLFGDVTIPVVLVGTSFSARTEFHFEGFLKQALGADVVNVAIEGQGPFVPMDRFLESDTIDQASPEVVIWEIPERYLSTRS